MAYVINVLPLNDPYIGALEWGGYVWTNTGNFRDPVHITYFLSSDTAHGGTAWTSVESAAYVNALQSWANVANITISAASDAASADLIGHSVPASTLPGLYGEHGTPEDAYQSTDQYDGDLLLGGRSYAHGYFNYEAFGWDYANPNGGLSVGGNGYWTLIHELGHGLGLAHPHDNGGGSGLFPGVTSSSSTGDNGLNQGIWTVMSYNATQDPSSANSNFNANSLWYDGSGNAVGNYGYFAGPMAFDIAAIQDLYGANNNYNTGSNNYVLPDTNAVGTYWTCIWDAGGNDSISYGGSRNVTINLTAATLDNSTTGGGVISSADGIHGGYTIAHGVVIENAYGGSGNDTLTGNSAANYLDGGAGADTMAGGAGADTYVVDNIGDVINEFGDGTIDQVNVYNLTSYTLGANLENLNFLGNPTTARQGYGNSLNNLIQTYHGDDILNGGVGADTMQGYGGDDTYYVDNVGDVILESANQGNDWAYVYLTSYTLGANVENLNYIGTNTSNFYGTGNELDNIIIGWSGNDTLNGLAGADTMRGLSGNDIYFVDNVGDVVEENVGAGIDWVEVSLSTYTLGANVENLDYNGVSTSNFVGYGNELDNIIQGWNGNDTLDGRAGADTMRGYNGDDIFFVDNAGDVVIEFSGEGTDTIFARASYVLAAGQSVETLRASSVSSTVAMDLTGNELDQTLVGNAGANRLDGGGGADRMTGYGGDDAYYVDNAGDLVFEASNGGNDTVFARTSYVLAAGQSIEILRASSVAGTTAMDLTGNEIAQSLHGNAGANRLDGGAGADAMWGYGGDDAYFVDNASDMVFETSGQGTDTVYARASYVLAAGQSVETLRASSVSSTVAMNLTGNSLAQTLYGNAGANVLDGGGGGDTLKGYGGDDTYVINSSSDLVFESSGQGSDTINSRVSYVLAAGQSVETLKFTSASGTGNLNLTGNEVAQTLTGNNGNNILDGGGGGDTMRGYAGDDTYVINSASELVFESNGQGSDTVNSRVSYTLAAGQSVETLKFTSVSGTGNYNLVGNEVAQTLLGNNGDNLLDGKGGADILRGYGGADTFRFSTTLGSGNVDHIVDFSAADDTIRLDQTIFAALGLGTLNPAAYKDITGGVAVDSSDRILYDHSTGALYYDADGSGTTPRIQFAILDNKPAVLTNADFFVVS